MLERRRARAGVARCRARRNSRPPAELVPRSSNLERVRASYEDEGRYEEAREAHRKWEAVTAFVDQRNREALQAQQVRSGVRASCVTLPHRLPPLLAQIAEQLGIEQAHVSELEEFNAIWDAKVGARAGAVGLLPPRLSCLPCAGSRL